MAMTSPIDINVPIRALLDAETKGSFVRWLANLNIERNLTSMFVNRYLSYNFPHFLFLCFSLLMWQHPAASRKLFTSLFMALTASLLLKGKTLFLVTGILFC